jgi:hypothetical protein
LTCDEVATAAVEMSADGDRPITLVKVRSPLITKDHRYSFRRPSGSGEAVVLECEGTAVWSDNSTSRVAVGATIDSDEDVFVYYEPAG